MSKWAILKAAMLQKKSAASEGSAFAKQHFAMFDKLDLTRSTPAVRVGVDSQASQVPHAWACPVTRTNGGAAESAAAAVAQSDEGLKWGERRREERRRERLCEERGGVKLGGSREAAWTRCAGGRLVERQADALLGHLW